MSGIPRDEYYKYREIQTLYGKDCDDLRMLDSYNRKWTIL